MPPAEETLDGGLFNRVVRVGSTVRRPSGPWTETVQAVLAHLVSVGFPAPRPLGLDEQGREVVEYIPGETALRPWPAALIAISGVRAVARLARDLHDAMKGFEPPPSPVWRAGLRSVLPGEIVRHGDLGPYNIVWRSGAPVAVIDWDLAYPGTALHDLAFLAWQVVPLRDDDAASEAGFASPPDRRARLEALADAYGLDGTLDLLIAAEQVHVEDRRRMQELGDAGRSPWTRFLDHGLDRRAEHELLWLQRNFETLL